MSARKRTPVAPTSPRLLTSLSQQQAGWLTQARDKDGGVYVPITAGCEPSDLVDAGAATFREVRVRSSTMNIHGTRPCAWTDTYLLPTEHGLALLRALERKP